MIDQLKLGLLALFILLGFILLFRPPKTTLPQWQSRVARDFPDVAQTTTEELAQWLSNPDKTPPILLDVRTPAEYSVSHLPGALLVPPGTATRELIHQFGTNAPAVLYCSIGYRASELARQLQRLGCAHITALDGSIFKWAREGRPLRAGTEPASTVHPYSPNYAHLLPAKLRADLPGPKLWWHGLPVQLKWRWMIAILLLSVLLAWESLAPAYAWFRDLKGRMRHFARNYFLGLLNVLLAALVFVQLWLLAARWADAHQFGLFHSLGLPLWARAVLAILLLDLATYTWHWLNHRIPFLWRFHRTHHSDTHLDLSSAARFHFGEITLSGLLRLPLILLLGLHLHELVLYELLLFATVQFHHANISLPGKLDHFLSHFIATPAYHRVHHSLKRVQADSNYSSFLTFWDRLFRTRSSATPQAFGVEGLPAPAHGTLIGMIESPLDD